MWYDYIVGFYIEINPMWTETVLFKFYIGLA